MHDACDHPGWHDIPSAPAPGRVYQVNVSPGGVPKLPVESARVGLLGLDGDGHNARTLHGGPLRAVCLYSIEAIERVRAEGHPIFPGSCGENLTLEGVELGGLHAGDRLGIGQALELEIIKPDNPCDTISGSFRDGRFARISIRTHPEDTRLYARVLREGTVRQGDPVAVLPPLPDSEAATHALLDRLDANELAYAVATWQAARAGGIDVRVHADGELAVAATPSVPDPNFNVALGLRELPHLMPEALAHFREHGVIGWVDVATPPWPDARPERMGAVLAGAPGSVGRAPEIHGLVVRSIAPAEVLEWEACVLSGFQLTGAVADVWMAAAPALAAHAKLHLFIAELDGRPVGGAGLFVHGSVGGLGPASTLPAFQRRSIHAALTAARARRAEELGLDILTSQAADGGESARNLERMGLRTIWRRGVYRFDGTVAGHAPGARPSPAVA
jgi:MOSC domain-containing protein YiiM